jgi:TonB family protein
MHSPTKSPKRRLPAVLLSIATHASVLAFLLTLGNAARTKFIAPSDFQAIALVQNAGGSHAIPIPLPPMDTVSHTRHPAPVEDVTRKSILPVPVETTHPKISGGGSPLTPHNGNGSGLAQLGNGSDNEDRTPAFPVFSPHPPITDRSLLPAHEQKIVVDVKLDALGQVVGETLVKGMGTKLDQMVLDIAKTWRFQPAKVNGKPVPSEAELVFPFNQSYPIAAS